MGHHFRGKKIGQSPIFNYFACYHCLWKSLCRCLNNYEFSYVLGELPCTLDICRIYRNVLLSHPTSNITFFEVLKCGSKFLPLVSNDFLPAICVLPILHYPLPLSRERTNSPFFFIRFRKTRRPQVPHTKHTHTIRLFIESCKISNPKKSCMYYQTKYNLKEGLGRLGSFWKQLLPFS